MAEAFTRIHEQDFCAEIAKAASAYFREHPGSPFADARIEGVGRGGKRKDLRFYDRTDKLLLTGEVRLPGATENSPYGAKLVSDAQAKADDANVRYFFTWNVNSFVLWDRYQVDVPLVDRRVREWPCERYFRGPDEVARPENLRHITEVFLPSILFDVGEICAGRVIDWAMPPDDVFIRSLESHLARPTDLTRAYLGEQAEKSRTFDSRLQEWMTAQSWYFVRAKPEEWSQALDRAARTIVYILANRLIFYQALRTRFPSLRSLRLYSGTPKETYSALRRSFEIAVTRSGDYDTLLFPETDDWAGELAFGHESAREAWRGVLRGIDGYDFSRISSDIVGRVFQRLISPEERHRWGQHFTGDDIVDFINAFSIRRAGDIVLDPACGSGSFLVRAYYRKQHLARNRPHVELISELFGSEIAPYPAHLATLNLAAREINDEENYPRIARRDFFDVRPGAPFCSLPVEAKQTEVLLPTLDAVVGNPPYVRQEKIGKDAKAKMAAVVAERWLGVKLAGRSDVHCYFWPAAAHFLREGGYFGFLTSSSWLDVEYGFPLQRWILQNFRIVAICESEAEPWFEDARVKTCATILQRCSDSAARKQALVKFVQFKWPLADIIAAAPESDRRFRAVDALRRQIEDAATDIEDERMRIIVKRQGDLWQEGVRAGPLLAGAVGGGEDEENAGEEDEGSQPEAEHSGLLAEPGDYAGAKWGRYVRAPNFYFEIMRRFGKRFVPLGEIADIRFGVKSGCDAFFMPHDITAWALKAEKTDPGFRRRFGVERGAIQRGEIKIVRDGEGGEHPIEAKYLAPEVHTLRDFQRCIVTSSDCDRVILLASEPTSRLRNTLVARYLRYGETHTFSSGKSKPVPVPKRSTCAAREPWYDLTKLVKPGIAFWPMAHQYRHTIPANPEALICNHRMFDVSAPGELGRVLPAIMNSTVTALFKTFYGRYTGTEGSLDTEVIDVRALEIPDPRNAPSGAIARILEAFNHLSARHVGRLLEDALVECRSSADAKVIAQQKLILPGELQQPDRRTLDEAVFEMLGIVDSSERRVLLDRLYQETAHHFRKIRIVEIQKQEQRSKSSSRRYSVQELASDAWVAADIAELQTLNQWIDTLASETILIEIPAGGAPSLLPTTDFYDGAAVYFGRGRNVARINCSSRAQAEIVAKLAALGLRGLVRVPRSEAGCKAARRELEGRLDLARARFEELAQTRSSNEKTQGEIVDLMMHWFVHGRPRDVEAPSKARDDTTD